MDNTLVLYKKQGYTVKKFAEVLSCTLGPAKTMLFQQFRTNFKNYSNLVILMSVNSKDDFYEYVNFVKTNSDELENKRVAILCTSLNVTNSDKLLKKICNMLDKCIIFSEYFPSLMDELEIANKALQIKRIFKDNSNMPVDILKMKIEEFLLRHNTCTLCTAHENKVRATPIEYKYLNQAIYFISEGGEKYAHIYVNHNVSIAVYENYKDFKSLAGVQISGTASLIERFSDEYNIVMEKRGLNIENLKNMPIYLNIIKVIPNKYEVIFSNFSKEGYNVKQVLHCFDD
ncbi:pyridoxamine 5'-phosphate oxidase family protein [Clostridium scatologenes]|uniref:Pyridoxamine 5'-phosphate oxidase family protein n=1 Tax=Clostridium scatologenes TaxID=1548 RepID=A0A0E3GQJ6_CLOSL|nr:pyridoxamine 5'-phosphate oxidase family protein [Clostridium scatologenes]AKA68686.1 pyridoxamine 5'-phosphate oxidase family protein [Clostridium scatologenes]